MSTREGQRQTENKLGFCYFVGFFNSEANVKIRLAKIVKKQMTFSDLSQYLLVLVSQFLLKKPQRDLEWRFQNSSLY